MNERDIFVAALEKHDRTERVAYLDEACGDDSALRSSIEGLLREHERLGSFIEAPAAELAHVALLPEQTVASRVESSPTIDSLETGILGDYRILREVGRGGMGVVYEAEQISLQRRVALKVLPFASVLDKTQAVRFKNEARAAASLDHPHVVHVYAVGVERGVHYYAMQFVDGQTVADLIATERRSRGIANKTAADSPRGSSGYEPTEAHQVGDDPSSSRSASLQDTARLARLSASTWRDSDEKERIDSAVKLAIQAAEAIEHAHRMGIVHRDIKPSNLLVDAERHLWVADFGLAMVEAEGNLTTSGSMLGTLRYMSPEQIRGDRHVLDHHTDIYSLGVTLYEMLTLQPAFPDSDVTRLMQRVTHDEPTNPRRINSAISRDLETIVLKAMAKEPPDRYATAGEMAADLRRFVTDEPIHAKPPSTFERSRKWGRRHRSIVRAVAATIAIAIVVAGGLLWHERSRTLAAFAEEKQQRRTAEQKEAEARRQALRASRAEDLAEKQAELANQQRHLAIAQKEEAVRNVYVAQMRLVMDEWNSGQISRLDTMLGQYLPQPGEQDFRGWEWYYALSLAHSELMTLQTDGDDLRAVAWSADGRCLASAGKSGLIKVWEADTGQELSTLKGHTDKVNALAFSPDSRRLASMSNDNTIRIWHLQEDRTVITLDSDANNAISVAWSPDGARLASGAADGVVRVRDTTTWQVLLELQSHAGTVKDVCWSPDGSRVASGGEDGTVKVWDVTTGEAIRTLVPPLRGDAESSGHGAVTSLAWSPDGEHLASSSLWPSVCICIWDVTSGEATAELGWGIGYRNAVAWSPDGKRLALGSDNNFVQIWEPAKGEPPQRICGHTGIVWSVAWSPDGRRLASCSQDTTVKIWDTQRDAESHSLRFETGSQRILVWSPDGTRLAVPGIDDHSLRVVDTATGQETLALHAGDERIVSVTWSPDGQLLACGNDDGTIGIWDVQHGLQVRTLRGHTQRVGSVDWSPDGQYLASGSDDTTARIWSLAAGKERFTLRGPKDVVDAVAWSPDGRRLACAPRGNSVTIWDTGTGQRQLTLVPKGWSYSFFGSVSWSADGRQIASAGHSGRIEVWDAMTGQQLACLRGHFGSTNANANVTWQPGGIRVATGSWDGTVQVWDPVRQQELLRFSGFFPVAWSPDGRQLAHAGADGTIKIRDASIGYRIAETPGYRLELGRHFSALGEHARAAEVYGLLVADYPDVREYQDLQQTETVRGLIEEEKLDEATAILHELIAQIPSPQRRDEASTPGGGTEVVQNDREKHIAALLEALATAYFRRGEFHAGLREGELACKLAPQPAKALNRLAWRLATCPDVTQQNPSEAVKLATKAVGLASEQGTLWNTLGVAQYRAANFKAALNSLNKSLELEPSGSSLPYNALFLAMAQWQLGEQEEARRWFDKATDWIVTNNLDNEELSRFRSEAETLLGVNAGEQKIGEKDNPLGDSPPVNGSSDRE